jgi:hypothetical protein
MQLVIVTGPRPARPKRASSSTSARRSSSRSPAPPSASPAATSSSSPPARPGGLSRVLARPGVARAPVDSEPRRRRRRRRGRPAGGPAAAPPASTASPPSVTPRRPRHSTTCTASTRARSALPGWQSQGRPCARPVTPSRSPPSRTRSPTYPRPEERHSDLPPARMGRRVRRHPAPDGDRAVARDSGWAEARHARPVPLRPLPRCTAPASWTGTGPCKTSPAPGEQLVRGSGMVRAHAIGTIVWVVLVVPTILWWRDSILWVLIMSLWANVSTHWGAWQAARAEQAQRDTAAADPLGDDVAELLAEVRDLARVIQQHLAATGAPTPPAPRQPSRPGVALRRLVLHARMPRPRIHLLQAPRVPRLVHVRPAAPP